VNASFYLNDTTTRYSFSDIYTLNISEYQKLHLWIYSGNEISELALGDYILNKKCSKVVNSLFYNKTYLCMRLSWDWKDLAVQRGFWQKANSPMQKNTNFLLILFFCLNHPWGNAFIYHTELSWAHIGKCWHISV